MKIWNDLKVKWQTICRIWFHSSPWLWSGYADRNMQKCWCCRMPWTNLFSYYLFDSIWKQQCWVCFTAKKYVHISTTDVGEDLERCSLFVVLDDFGIAFKKKINQVMLDYAGVRFLPDKWIYQTLSKLSGFSQRRVSGLKWFPAGQLCRRGVVPSKQT